MAKNASTLDETAFQNGIPDLGLKLAVKRHCVTRATLNWVSQLPSTSAGLALDPCNEEHHPP